MENHVKISLLFTGDELPLETISAALDIIPTHKRKKAEWRIQNDFACDEWCMDLEKINCYDVDELFEKFIEIFENKTDLIKEICMEYNCEVYVMVVIYLDYSSRPYVCLSPETISFIHLIGAKLQFDIYEFEAEDD